MSLSLSVMLRTQGMGGLLLAITDPIRPAGLKIRQHVKSCGTKMIARGYDATASHPRKIALRR